MCQNEGVYTLQALLNLRMFEDIELSKIEGLCFRDKDGNINTSNPSSIVPKSKLEVDLPGVAWDLLPKFDKYRTRLVGTPGQTNSHKATFCGALY